MKRVYFAAIAIAATLMCLAVSTAWVRAQDDAGTPKQDAPAANGVAPATEQPVTTEAENNQAPLSMKQDAVALRYKRFEKTLRQMAEYLRGTDPDRANLLYRAINQSSENRISQQLDEIVALLTDEHPKFGEAIERQQDAKLYLQALLKLLQSEDRKAEVEKERKRIEELLQNIKHAIGEEKKVRHDTNRPNSNADRIAKDQERVKDETDQIGKKIDRQDAERNGDSGKKQSGDKQSGSKQSGGKSQEGEKSDQEDGSGDKKSDEEKDESKQSDDKKSGEKDADGNSSDKKKDGESKDDESKNREPKAGDEKGDDSKQQDKKSEEEKKGEEQSPGEKSDGKKSSEGKPGEKQSKPGKSGQQGEQGEQSESQPGESKPGEQGEQESENKPLERTPGREELEKAKQEMEEAIQKLNSKKLDEASGHQDEAIKKLIEAKERLEEILRQLREEERELLLAALEARFQKMLAMQLLVNKSTVDLSKVAKQEWTSQQFGRARELSGHEDEIAVEAAKALNLLKEEGSSVAFPEAVMQLRQDMLTVARRLERSDVAELTQGIEQDIVESLEELVEALRKEMEKLKEEQDQKQKKQQQGQPQDKALVDALAELKMLRSLQHRINRRTRQLGELTKGEQAVDPDAVTQLQQLSQRQARVQEATYDLSTGKNR